MTDWTSLYASRMAGVVGSDIRERAKLLDARQIIHLGGGLPDPEIFPYARLAQASAAIWADPARARTALQYAPSEGHGPLREWIAGHMTARGVPCTVDNILITNGSQQGLDFIAKLLLSPGDTAMVEIPSFIGALRAFDAYQPQYVGLPEDAEDWADPALGGAKFCYVGPDFRNPTGTTMTLAEREALLDLAERTGIAIVEDGCYEDLRYDGAPLPSLIARAVARHGSIESAPVLHTGTFSKTVAPSLRVGWIAGPAEAIRKLVLIKQASDLATSAFNQMLLLDVVREGLGDMIAEACRVYRGRRDAMLATLARVMPEGVTWTEPGGGLYIWLDLPERIDATLLSQRALAEHHVSAISGAAFYPKGAANVTPRHNCLRLSFSMIGAEPARIGVERLAALVREMMAESAVAA
ncbi:PLP-dependent aminotransferase family protein [Sphingomonas jatrophae]|uniref:DNA-binding transcriptional regulator, MocR family, contains an aminotransferase domain n=1 Tax=Sphingomonas jatrophae TaxID=1166337 RepID=A0A1I6M4J3_9SPHN|nr:PLP-dependent aminotransferase family protein [Sphingomonas jatrophae]SFS10606.1 DNA-binding transcriptional regulator, MocR family, contains an aminotransferase domain [Sphingomonas jatrophae]